MAALPLRRRNWTRRLLVVDLVGVALFLLGIHPATFGIDRSPVIGYVQVTVFLFGLGVITLVTYVISWLQRPASPPVTLVQDIGARLMATGYVLSALSSTADLIGLGSEPLPRPPHFGTLQTVGLLVGALVTLVGLIMNYPRPPRQPHEGAYPAA